MIISKFCARCGARCNNKFLVEARKGVYYPFCSWCFSDTRDMDFKQIRKEIKKGR